MYPKVFSFLLLVLFISCKKDNTSSLDFLFNKVEESLDPTKVEAFKDAEISLVFDRNIFSNKLAESYYDSVYHNNYAVFIDSLGYGKSEFFDPIDFLRYAFHRKLNNKKFDLEIMKSDFNRLKEKNRIAEEANYTTDAQFLLEDVIRGKLSSIKKGDTLNFVLPITGDSITHLNYYSTLSPDDTFNIKAILVDWVDNSKTIFLLHLVFAVELTELDRGYLIDGVKYNVGDTLYIPLEMELSDKVSSR